MGESNYDLSNHFRQRSDIDADGTCDNEHTWAPVHSLTHPGCKETEKGLNTRLDPTSDTLSMRVSERMSVSVCQLKMRHLFSLLFLFSTRSTTKRPKEGQEEEEEVRSSPLTWIPRWVTGGKGKLEEVVVVA